MEMVSDVVRDKVFITTTYRSRDNAIKHFANRYELSSMYPTFKTQPSPDGRVYPVVVHDAKAMIESLLYSPLMDNHDNLLFPNPDNPLEGPPPSQTCWLMSIQEKHTVAHIVFCARNQIIFSVGSYCTLIRLQLIATATSPLNQCILR